MSVRKRKWRDKQGHTHERWMVHIAHTWPDGRKQTIRKVSPVQTKRGAEQYERQLRQLLISNQWKEHAKQQPPTLEAFVDEFIAYQATINKPSTIRRKRELLTNHLLPAFGKRRLDQIDERMIDRYKVDKLAQHTRRGTPYQAKSVNLHLKLLGRMLNIAKKWKLIREVPDIALLKERKSDFDFLDFDEAERFLQGVAEHAPDWYPYMVVALRTGLRVGEMVALRWREDIDLERARLTVNQSYGHDNGFDTTKNDKQRELPLTWDACEALHTQRARSTGPLVFTREGREAHDDKSVQYVIDKVTSRIGMRHLHNHVLRHSFASHAAMRGVPMKQIQEWLGHSSMATTMRYAHLAKGYGDELIKRLAPPCPATRPAKPRHKHSTRKPKRPNSSP